MRLLFLLLLYNPVFSQKMYQIDDILNLNDTIYSAISKYKVIWVGEMHGAKEPALMTEGIVKLLLNQNIQVTLAIEIPKDKITAKDSISISKSLFFNSNNYGNRATDAWLNLCTKFLKNKNVKLLFFDSIGETKTDSERDSIMAINLLKGWKKTTKLVVLSGNLHNMLEERKGQKKAALYMVLNSNNTLKTDDILSLNHSFLKGKIMTSFVGEEIKLTEFDYSKYDWSKQKMYQNNHLFIFPKLNNGWAGQFFTINVNPANLIK